MLKTKQEESEDLGEQFTRIQVWWSYFFFFFFPGLFRAAPAANGSCQARSQIRAAAAGLCHSHSHTRSEPCLWPTPQLMAALDPYSTEQGQGSNLHPHGSWVRFLTHWATMGTPNLFIFISEISHKSHTKMSDPELIILIANIYWAFIMYWASLFQTAWNQFDQFNHFRGSGSLGFFLYMK